MSCVLRLVSDIRFWLLLFFLVRLVGITNPPLEKGHNWRQTTGLMVARNFLEVDNDIRYPRVDDNYGKTGIIGMEFPLLNYGHYLMAEAFGYEHWYGRLINLVVSTFGIWFFYLIVSRYFTVKVALYASLVLLSSIWFAFSRKMMPDTFCISLMMAGLYFGLTYFKEHKPWQLLLYILFAGLGILSKIPAGIYLAVFIVPLWQHKKEWQVWLPWLLGSFLVMGAMYQWYFVWNPHLADVYGNWYNSGQSLSESLQALSANLGNVAERFYFSALHSYVFLACFLGGLVWALVQRQWLLLGVFGLVLAVFVVYVLRSGFFFQHHNYYIIPFVPMMALVAGYGLVSINKQWVLMVLLAGGMIEGITNQWHDFFIKDSEKYKLELEAIADQVSEPDDLIAVLSEGNPQELYLAHRKGFLVDSFIVRDAHMLDLLIKTGGGVLIVNKSSGITDDEFGILYEDEHYLVYNIAEAFKPLTEEELRQIDEMKNQNRSKKYEDIEIDTTGLIYTLPNP